MNTQKRNRLQNFGAKLGSIERRVLLALLSRVRSFRIRLDAWLYGGTVVLGRGVRFHHRTRFRGQGTLILEDAVVLGFPLAGAQGDTILLEPRNSTSVVRIGAGTVVVNGTDIVAVDRVDIGERCRIGSRCTIVDSDFHGISPEKRDQAGNTTPVEIGNNVWLGLEVVVLKGVTMGNDSIAGARAVVTQDVPPGGIAVSPAAKIAGSVYVD